MTQIAGPDHWRCAARDAAGDQCVLVAGHAGDHANAEQARSAPPPSVLVRAYRGRTQAEAAMLMAPDASSLAAGGYVVASQAWAGPSAARMVATPLALAILGYVVLGLTGAAGGLIGGLLYVLLATRNGTLTVTYQRMAS